MSEKRARRGCLRLASRDEIETRVMRMVEIDEETGCWIWRGTTSGKRGRGRNGRGHGYPRMTLRGQSCAVHRVMFINRWGHVPSKTQLDHTCGNRLCVNPDHLEMVTQRENCRRRDEVNRSRKETE